MLSTIKLKINDSRWENYSLWKYIKLALPHYTKLLIIKELRLKKILVNDKLSYFQYKLQLGDVISIIPVKERESSIQKSSINTLKNKSYKWYSIKEQIVFENSEIIVLNKKAGQVVQPSSKLSNYSLEELLQLYLQSENKLISKLEYQAKFIHRIDNPVSGLLIGAKTANSHKLLSNALKNREIKKIYRAIVFGSFPTEFLKLTNWIIDKYSKVKVLTNSSNQAKLAILEIKRLKRNSKYSYLEINLITGRKNQIRTQLAHLGFPILGDRKYYSEKFKSTIKWEEIKKLPFNSKQIALISYQIIFPNNLLKQLNLSIYSIQLPARANTLINFLKNI